MVEYKTGDVVIRTRGGMEGTIGKIIKTNSNNDYYYLVKVVASQHKYPIGAEDLWADRNFRLTTKLELLLAGIDNV